MLSLFIKQKWLSYRNSVTPAIVIRRLPFVAIGIVFWILFYLASYNVLSYIRGVEFLGEILSERLFSLIFFSLAGFLILSTIITSLSSFYLSRDIPFLLAKPVALRHIIRLKTFDAVLNSSWMVMSFVPPVFIAYGVSYGASPGYYPAILAVFLMFILITSGIGISLAHILTRLFPVRGSRNILLGLGLLLFVMLYFLIQSLIPKDLSTPEKLIDAFIRFRADSPLMPWYWVSVTVLPMLKGKGPDLFFLVVLISNSTFFMLLSAVIGSRLYRRNIDTLQPAGGRKGQGFLGGHYPGRAAALSFKDAKLFLRDTGQWSQIFIIGALMMVYIHNFKTIPVDALLAVSPYMKELMVAFNMVMTGLVLSAVAARFLYTSVSYEGQAFWIIKTSPITMREFLWSKFLYGCIPVTSLIVILVFLTNSALKVQGPLLYASAVTAIMLCISVSGLGTGLGAINPKFRYENIASVSMSLGGMAFMLLAFSIVVLTLSLEAWVYYLWAIKVGIHGASGFIDKVTTAACIAAILLINAGAFYLPMRAGERKLERGEE